MRSTRWSNGEHLAFSVSDPELGASNRRLRDTALLELSLILPGLRVYRYAG